MNEQLTKQLNEKYPNLYRRNRDRNVAIPFGFEHGDGWYDLIDRLSAKLEAEILKMNMRDRVSIYAQQVKEKFGTLRFYMTSGTDEMYKAIDEAEMESAKTCEDCGQLGEIRSGSWIRTLCDNCTIEGAIDQISRALIHEVETYEREITYGPDKGKKVSDFRYKNGKRDDNRYGTAELSDEAKESLKKQLNHYFVLRKEDKNEA